MPIFVDGVEISSVFVDGVEINNVFSDGVEVFSGVDPGEVFFDDFLRSANGTPIESHIMNTGQTWIRRPGFTNVVTIQPLLGEQVAHAGLPAGLVTMAIMPVSVEAPIFTGSEAWVIEMDCLWSLTTPPSSGGFIQVGNAGSTIHITASYAESIPGGEPLGTFTMYNEAVTLQQQTQPSIHQGGNVIMYLDLVQNQVQMQVIVNGIPVILNRHTLHFIPVEVSLNMFETAFQGGATAVGVARFAMTPYTSSNLPWPN